MGYGKPDFDRRVGGMLSHRRRQFHNGEAAYDETLAGFADDGDAEPLVLQKSENAWRRARQCMNLRILFYALQPQGS